MRRYVTRGGGLAEFPGPPTRLVDPALFLRKANEERRREARLSRPRPIMRGNRHIRSAAHASSPLRCAPMLTIVLGYAN